MKQNNAVGLHLDEINMQACASFFDKVHFLGNAQNNAEKLANSMQVFLLTTLHGKKHRINLCSKPAHNMKSQYLQNALKECLDKTSNSNFEVASITLDRASTNCKLAREFLELLNDKANKPIPEMKFSTYFMRNNSKIFIFFCIIHIIKCMRNNLTKKGNYFKYPTLVLSNGEVLEEGICTINWVKELCNKNKNELISSCRIHKNTVNPDSLAKQKVKPALALFSTELTKALELE